MNLVKGPAGTSVTSPTAECSQCALATTELSQPARLLRTRRRLSFWYIDRIVGRLRAGRRQGHAQIDVSWNQSWTGGDQVGFYKVEGNVLTITTAINTNPRAVVRDEQSPFLRRRLQRFSSAARIRFGAFATDYAGGAHILCPQEAEIYCVGRDFGLGPGDELLDRDGGALSQHADIVGKSLGGLIGSQPAACRAANPKRMAVPPTVTARG